ncbi:MAG: nucleoside-diphosphate sugar epimerase [Rhodoferax sp.]|nr:nucleoside-diphosphate sugar epimerase [Rhodoferax sp.]
MAATAADARVALVAGATGLVGREVLAALLADKRYTAVHIVGRRKLPHQHPKLTQQVVNFSAMGKLPPVDDVFIALGTTIKTAGSKQAFRAVDYEAIMAVALAARAQGATKLGVVSAMGADASSSIFYNQVKGEMEAGLETVGYDSLVIARPSMLAGNREALDQPARSGERIALVATRWLKAVIPANYQSIAARDVAYALVNTVADASPGVFRMLSGEMQGASVRG